jgi:glycosyltransferase involved in cell wall biosynthesis
VTARVSIVLPTYKRADTLLRAVASVRAQTFQDWELVVIDDGSTDGTSALLEGVDPRLRLVRQENQGVAAARNRGLREARGDLLAFLDSDDEWTPHHLELAVAFFDAHPGEHLYSCELWEDFGRGILVKHFRTEIADWYPATAAQIGSSAFSAAAPLGDDYLRIYAARAEVGEWGRAVVERSGHRGVFHYQGNIFEHWRWGWLMSVHPTVITRHALETVGPFDARIPVANDFAWLARLCERFTAHFLSLPGAVKHELARGDQALTEDHLASGKTAVRFHQDVLQLHEELFWSRNQGDPELAALRGFRQYLVAEAAAKQGATDLALEYLRASRQTYPTWDARRLRWLLELSPTPAIARRAYHLSLLPRRARARFGRLLERVGAHQP